MRKNRSNKGLSTVFGTVLFIVLLTTFAAVLFTALYNYNGSAQAGLSLEEERAQERIVLVALSNDTTGEHVLAVRVNNTGSISVRIRAVYIDDLFLCDPSDPAINFGDTYINPQESRWIMFPEDVHYDPMAKIIVATERGIKSLEYEWKLKTGSQAEIPSETQRINFGPLLLNFTEFYYTDCDSDGTYDPYSWKAGWSVEDTAQYIVWNVTVTNIDDRDITISQFSCLTLVPNDGPAAQKPWYLEPSGTQQLYNPASPNELRIPKSKSASLIYIWDTPRTTAQHTQSIYNQDCRNKVFLTFFGKFHEHDGTTKPYGQTIPFEAVLIRPPQIEISANPSIIAANSTMQSTITVIVRTLYGDPEVGATVNFYTDLGTLSAPSSITTSTGTASVFLRPGSEVGTANVTAACGTLSKTVAVTIAQATISVTSNPTIIAAGSTMTSIITANIKLAGAAVENGLVTFSTSMGSLSPPTTRTTDAAGDVTITLSPGPTPGTATVTAAWQGLNATTEVYIALASVEVKSEPTVIPAGSNVTSNISARVTFDGPVVGETVTFSTTSGTVSPSSAMIDINGYAVVALRAGIDIENAVVTATWQGISGQTTVNIVEGAVIVSSNPTIIPANSTMTSTITIFVRYDGNPLDNAPVGLTTSVGQLSSNSVTTDSSGLATVTLIPAESPGNAVVTATWVGIENSTTVTIAEPSINIYAIPDTIPANSTSTIYVSITLGGDPVKNSPVSFTATIGTLSVYNTSTDEMGSATSVLNPDPTDNGISTITIEWFGLLKTTTVTITGG